MAASDEGAAAANKAGGDEAAAEDLGEEKACNEPRGENAEKEAGDEHAKEAGDEHATTEPEGDKAGEDLGADNKPTKEEKGQETVANAEQEP